MDTALPLKIRRSKRARRLALRLDAKERIVNLVIPAGIPLKRAKDFALKHEDWIRKKIDELPEPVPFGHGAWIPVLGRLRTIRIHYNETLRKTDIALKEREITVYTNLDDPAPRIRRFLKDLAREELTARAKDKARLIRRRVNHVQVRDTKSRWGSCSSDGYLSFSWRLIFAPPEALDYVIAHEVAHLIHLDHGTGFWNLCRRLSADYLEGRFWMDNYGQELMSYGQDG